MNFNEIQRDDWIVAGAALLLLIDLLFLPWFSFSFGPFHVSTTATGSFDGWTAILAVLACLLIIIDIGVERLSPSTTVPSIGAGRTHTRFVLAAVAAAFVALKFVLHIHFSDFGFGFYAGIVLAVALVVVARRAATDGGIYRPPGPIAVGRLRVWEVLAAAGAIVLVVALFGLHWYGGPPRTGWAAVPTLRWFALVSAAFGLLLAVTQVTSRGVSLPAILDLLGGPVAGLTTILLAIRLITTGATLRAGAYVGVVAAAAIAVGAFRALRTEQGWTPGPERPIELVELSSAPR